MGQGVQVGRGSQLRGLARVQQRVVDGETGQFAAGAGSGVDRKEWRETFRQLVQSFVIADVAAVGNHYADAFGCVVGAAAAEGNDTVSFYVLVDLDTVSNVLVGWVRLGAIKNGCLQSGRFKLGLDLVSEAELAKPLVGDDQQVSCAERLCFRSGFVGAPNAVKRYCWGEEEKT